MEFKENLHIDKNIMDILEPGDAVYLGLYYNLDNKIIVKTMITEIDEKYITLTVEQKDNPLSQINPGVNIVVFFRRPTRSNDYVFLAKFIQFNPEESSLVIERKDKIFLGRKYFRCDVRLPFSYTYVREIPGEVFDLSVSGLFAEIEPDERIRVGSTLTCKIVLPSESKPVFFTGKITWLKKVETKYGIGVTFLKINDEYLNQINKYLFKRQQDLIMQKKFRVVK